MKFYCPQCRRIIHRDLRSKAFKIGNGRLRSYCSQTGKITEMVKVSNRPTMKILRALGIL